MKPRRALAFLALCAAPAAAQITVYSMKDSLAWDGFGSSGAGVGDVDGDGIGDFAVGAPYSDLNGTDSGSVRVYSGRDGSQIRILLGDAGDRFGWSVDGVGDVDGDGQADLIVGSPGFAGGVTVDRGVAEVLSGATGAVLWDFKGVWSNDRTGESVAGLGDWDGDGDPDVAIGQPGYDDQFNQDSGRVMIRDAATGAYVNGRVGETAGDLLGTTVAPMGPLPGYPNGNLLAGAPGYGASFEGRGYVFVASTSLPVHVVTGAWAFGWMGFGASALGDVDGDGWEDFGFGEPGADLNGAESGRVVVCSGATGAILNSLPGPGTDNFYGWDLARVGDVDGDGRDDFAVGSPYYDTIFGGQDAGRVYVVSGANGATLSWIGGGTADFLGQLVASVGDLNGDGSDEVLVGSPGDSPNGTASGSAKLMMLHEAPPGAYCQAKTNSQGCNPYIGAPGAPSLTIGDNFHLVSFSHLNQSAGMAVLAFNPGNTPLWGGTLCLGVSIKRTAMQWSSGSPTGDDCTGSFDLFFSQAYMQTWGFQAGQTVYAQYWSRDRGFAAPNDVGLSNALSFKILP